jgi:hypothetical protein
VDPRIIALYDEYTHAPLPRRTFLERLAVIAGGAAAASALLPMLENNYARAATVEPGDARIVAGMADIKVPSGTMRAYVATPKDGPREARRRRRRPREPRPQSAHRGRGAPPRARGLHGRRRRHAVAAGRHAGR